MVNLNPGSSHGTESVRSTREEPILSIEPWRSVQQVIVGRPEWLRVLCQS